MAQSSVTKQSSADDKRKSMLYDGDFIDLTSETEPQSNIDEEVVLPTDPLQNNQISSSKPVSSKFKSLKKSTDNICLNSTNPRTGSDKVVTQKNLNPSNANLKLKNVPTSAPLIGNINQVVPQCKLGLEQSDLLLSKGGSRPMETNTTKPTQNKKVVSHLNFKSTGGRIIVEENRRIVGGGLDFNQSILQDILEKKNARNKNIGENTSKIINHSNEQHKEAVSLPKPLNVASPLEKSCPSTVIRDNKKFNPLSNVSSKQQIVVSGNKSLSQDMDVEDVVLVPSRSELKEKSIFPRKQLTTKLMVQERQKFTKNVDQSDDDDVILVPVQSQDNSRMKIVESSRQKNFSGNMILVQQRQIAQNSQSALVKPQQQVVPKIQTLSTVAQQQKYLSKVANTTLTPLQPKPRPTLVTPQQQKSQSKSPIPQQRILPNFKLGNDKNQNGSDIIVLSDNPEMAEPGTPKLIRKTFSLPGKHASETSVNKNNTRDTNQKKYVYLRPKQVGPETSKIVNTGGGAAQKRQTVSVSMDHESKNVSVPALVPLGKQSNVAELKNTKLVINNYDKAFAKSLQNRWNFKVQSIQTRPNPQTAEMAETAAAVNSILSQDIQIVDGAGGKGQITKNIQIPVVNINQNSGGQPVYFLLYPIQTPQAEENVQEEEEVEEETVTTNVPESQLVENSDDELYEPIYVEPEPAPRFVTQAPAPRFVTQAPAVDVEIEPACLVTPVDITKILNEGKKPQPQDRCGAIKPKNNSQYVFRGFTVREIRKLRCHKYIKDIIKDDEKKISDFKKSSSLFETDFIPCDMNGFNNFLPEIVKYELDDSDEQFTIEYNNIEDQLMQEAENATALPTLSEVISRVNEEVRHLKQIQHRPKAKEKIPVALGKPEAALKLIREGLELIKSWSNETQLKDKGNKLVTSTARNRRKNAEVEQPKIRTRSTPGPAKEPVKTRTRRKTKKDEAETVQERTKSKVNVRENAKRGSVEEVVGFKKQRKTSKNDNAKTKLNQRAAPKKTGSVREEPKKRKRKIATVADKRRRMDLNDSNDNELLFIKKIDIFNENHMLISSQFRKRK